MQSIQIVGRLPGRYQFLSRVAVIVALVTVSLAVSFADDDPSTRVGPIP
jgi:hypothetical protein